MGAEDDRFLEPFLNNAELRVLAAIRHGGMNRNTVSDMIGMPSESVGTYAKRLEAKGLIRVRIGYKAAFELRGSWADVIQRIRDVVNGHHAHILLGLKDYEEHEMPPAWRKGLQLSRMRPHGVSRKQQSFVEAKPRDW